MRILKPCSLALCVLMTQFYAKSQSADVVSRAAYDSLLKRVEAIEASQRGFEAVDGQTGATRGGGHDDKHDKNGKKKKSKVVLGFNKEYNDEEEFSKFRVGGYGEMWASYMDYGPNRFNAPYGSYREEKGRIAIPRFVLAGDYKFNRWFQMGAEIEFESGGTGSTFEYEIGTGSENGEAELEIEKGGEVALEQFHITATIFKELNVRAGHIIVPVGLTNSHHEPVNFFGTRRPEGETKIIPSTWHETGLELFGSLGKGWYNFDYQLQVVTGLTADEFDRYNFVGGASQGIFEEDNFSCPAYVARVNYNGVPGLRVGGSWYYLRDAGKNAIKPYKYNSLSLPVRLYSADAEYKNKYVVARGNFLYGNVGNVDKLAKTAGFTGAKYTLIITSPSGMLSGTIPYHEAVSYAAEVGINIGAFIPSKKPIKILPFARYEYYNPQWKDDVKTSDPRTEVAMWTVGVNWFALPNLVVKLDWTTRHFGTDNPFRDNGYVVSGTKINTENDLSIGIAYVGWFVKK